MSEEQTPHAHAVQTRECIGCGESRPMDSYYVYNGKRVKRCKDCIAEYQRARVDAIQSGSVDPPAERRCRCCNQVKSIDRFGPVKTRADGKNTKCRDCCKIARDKKRAKNIAKNAGVDPSSLSKACRKCGETKALVHYKKDDRRPDGRVSACNECQWASLTKEQRDNLNAKKRRRYATDSGFRAKILAGKHKRAAANKLKAFNPPNEKRCYKCKETKPGADFYRDSTKDDGLDSRCKQCAAHEQRQRRSKKKPAGIPSTVPANRRVVDRQEFEQQTTLDVLTKLSAKLSRQISAKNIQARKSLDRYHRLKSDPDFIDACRKSSAKYKKTERGRAQRSLNRHARRAAAGKCSPEQRDARFEYHDNKCVFCGSTEDLTLEHLIPVSKGGTNWPANLAPACYSCNSRKGAKGYKEFGYLCKR